MARELRRFWHPIPLAAICGLLLFSMLGFPLSGTTYAQQVTPQASPPLLTGFNLTNARRATVSITQVSHTPNGLPVIDCVGSGTLVSADGLILTNAHFAEPSSRCPSDGIVVGLPVQADLPPVATYYADVVEINVGWDLAVLRIARTLDGRTVDPATLSLPYVALGDSDALQLDNALTVIGYSTGAGTGNGGAIAAPGTITNFLDEALVGDHAWIKTNATLPGGMSGGGAYNAAGQLIGIPTIEPSPDQPQACRAIQDTNGDGRVDERDRCVPVGGLITELRPASLARGLVRAAQLGITASSSDESSLATGRLPQPSGAPQFNRLLFAPGVNAAGMPTTIISSAPNGTKSLYLFFDYDNLIDGTIYELRTTIDGVPSAEFSLSPGTWSGGVRGTWYIGSHAQIWPNGVYVFTLLLDGQRTASQQITVGGAAQTVPTFSDILVGTPDSRGHLVMTGNVLPVQDTLTAQFVYANIPDNTNWRQTWYYEGQAIAKSDNQPWRDGPNGTKQVSASANNSLRSGRYRLELYLNDQLAATADFIMAGLAAADKVQVFDKLAFASDINGKTPSGVNTVFPNTQHLLYATFVANGVAPGTIWTWRWSVDGNPLFERTQPWQGTSEQTAAWLRLDTPQHLPDGSYSIELLVAGVSMGQATAKVGLGQLPIGLFAVPTGVQVGGIVTDAETGKPIIGATVILLKSTVGTVDFTGQMSDVDELLATDVQGRFQLTRLLPRGNSYSLIIQAAGYLPLKTDALNIDDKTPNPLTITAQLNRD